MNRSLLVSLSIVALLVSCAVAHGRNGSTSDTLPITEVTAFKDGHALVLRDGAVALNADGDAVLSELPRPILGAFWADSGDARARLASVVSERIDEQEVAAATSVPDLLGVNIGARIAFLDVRNELREGVLLEIVEREPEKAEPPQRPAGWNDWQWQQHLRNTQPPGAKSRIALIETETGIASIPVEQVRDVRFLDGTPNTSMRVERQRERMTLDLEWDADAPDEGAVRLMYVQKGLRWIPSYRVTVLDDEHVRLELQATIVNELADLDDVTMNFAVGVPSFAFESSIDPMGLQDALAELGAHFRASSGTGSMFSNAIRSQSAIVAYDSNGSSAQAPASPALTGSERAEDLFVYTVERLSLRKGARMVVPLVSYEVCYESLYRLELPARPPFDGSSSIPHERRTAIERALTSPIPTHVLRILNDNPDAYPITTAPALVIKDGRTLAQGLLTYAAPGGTSDLDVGKGVAIAVEAREIEQDRELKALRWNNSDYARASVEFSAALTNRKPTPVRMEIVKIAFGESPEGGQDAGVEVLSPYDPLISGEREWSWWRGYAWPWWWSRFNSAARIRWDVTIDAGERVELDARWGYYWR